jgi:hypothetical protein
MSVEVPVAAHSVQIAVAFRPRIATPSFRVEKIDRLRSMTGQLPSDTMAQNVLLLQCAERA